MTGPRWGRLLLSMDLGDGLRPLTLRQLQQLRQALKTAPLPEASDRPLTEEDLTALGISPRERARILALLDREAAVSRSLDRAADQGIFPLLWGDPDYPRLLLQRLGEDAPALLFTRGDREILLGPFVSLVGSRQLSDRGRTFAQKAGTLAALEGMVLCSGNAEGADRTAQYACLAGGGCVLSILADSLEAHPVPCKELLFVTEGGWELPFSAARALSRNRLIHALGDKVLVAQSDLGRGGTWRGTEENLRKGRTPVFVHDDGTPGAADLIARGGAPVRLEDFGSITNLQPEQIQLTIDS